MHLSPGKVPRSLDPKALLIFGVNKLWCGPRNGSTALATHLCAGIRTEH